MSKKFAVKAGAVAALASLALGAGAVGTAAAAPPRVTVRVEGLSHTLLRARRVELHRGWFTRAGHGRGTCSRASAQAAMSEAVHGRWSGVWYASYSEWEITRILGARPGNKSHWWELFVDNHAAASGACQTHLRAGDRVVFAAVGGNGEDLLGYRMPGAVTRGRRFRVRVVYYDAHGRAHPLSGATVNLNGHRTRTSRAGFATLQANIVGLKPVTISHRGYVRIERRVRVRA